MERKYDWLTFSRSYLLIAKLACAEMVHNKYREKFLGKMIHAYPLGSLYIPTIYNVKHGIEIFLKTLKRFLGDDTEFEGKQGHNVKLLFKELQKRIRSGEIKKIIDQKLRRKPQDTDLLAVKKYYLPSINKYIATIERFVSKYQHCEFMKDKIESDFEIDDIKNDAFRYPENNLKIALQYEKILMKIEEEDIKELSMDIDTLLDNFPPLGYILSVCYVAD